MSSPSHTITATDINGVETEYPGGCGEDKQSWIAHQNIINRLKADPSIVEIIITDDWGGLPQVVKRL